MLEGRGYIVIEVRGEVEEWLVMEDSIFLMVIHSCEKFCLWEKGV